MPAKCQQDRLDGTESRLLRVDVEWDASFGVACDLANQYGVQAQPDDQVRDERSTEVVRRYGRAPFAVWTPFLVAAAMPLFRTLRRSGDSCRILFDY